jgi:hypothetical protein
MYLHITKALQMIHSPDSITRFFHANNYWRAQFKKRATEITLPTNNRMNSTVMNGNPAEAAPKIDDVLLATREIRETAIKTEKDLLTLRHTVESYIEVAERKYEKQVKMSVALQQFNLKDLHLELDRTLEYIEKALHNCSTHEQMLVCSISDRIY